MTELARSIATPIGPCRPRRSLLARIGGMIALRRQRQHLAQLDARLLQDVGLTAAQAGTEAARPAWDAPPHWFYRNP